MKRSIPYLIGDLACAQLELKFAQYRVDEKRRELTERLDEEGVLYIWPESRPVPSMVIEHESSS